MVNSDLLQRVLEKFSRKAPGTSILVGFDGFISVSPLISEYVKNINNNNPLNIRFIDFIYPPHNEEKFLNFIPTKSRKEFFKDNFKIDVKDFPIIVMVANFEA